MLFCNSHRAYDFTLLTPGVPNWVDTQIACFDPKKRKIPLRKEYLSPHWKQPHILTYVYYSANISFPPYTKEHSE